nr:unnamed protein product [Callosobruchus chinensis]
MVTPKFNYLMYYEKDFAFIRYLGMWIPGYEDKHTPLRFMQWFTISTLTMIPNVIAEMSWCLNNTQDMKQLIGSIYLTFISMAATVKTFLVFRNRRRLALVLGWIKDDIFQPNDLKQLGIAEAAVRFHRLVKNWVIGTCCVAVSLLFVSPLLDRRSERHLPLPAATPFDYSYSPLYVIAYTYQTFSVICQAVVNIYSEVIFTSFTTFVGVQCDFICHELKYVKLLQAEDIGRLVQHHKRTILFTKTFDAVFSMIYFIEFASITLAMCMSMFILTAVENQNYMSLFLVMFQFTVFFLILCPCWFASEMQRKSEKIPQAAFCSFWVGATNSVRKDLICFIANTQKPLKLHAVDFFEISMNLENCLFLLHDAVQC